MEVVSEIKMIKTQRSRINDVDFSDLGFGKVVTDHMFTAEFNNNAWNDAQILPFGEITVSPTTLALHYGQTVFEGMKAFRMHDGRISIFRLAAHHKRFNASLKRLCMAEVPFSLFSDSICKLIETDEAWLKPIKGTSLYIRPFMFASEQRYGVKVSDSYTYMVFAGAVGEYYSKPLKAL